MPENASRAAAALYDQFEDEHPVADWGGDELFTRMPRPRAVDDAPAPRFHPSLIAQEPPPRARRPSLALVDPPANDRRAPAAADAIEPRHRRRASRAAPQNAEQAMLERAERLGLALMEPARGSSGAPVESPPGRPTKVITGHPGGAPRPLPTVRSDRRRPARTPAEWVGPRPERLVGWAFALGLVLILIAIFTS